jgi:tetratricopeptide (TPR) repeat protein
MAPNKRELADKLKAKANQAYATKHFADAISLYTEAHQLVPTEPVYLSNRAAAHFETGEYAASIVDDKAASELLRGHENVGSEVVELQASGEQGDLAKTAEAKRLQLLEKVLKRLRRAAIQKRDWEAYKESSRLLSEVDGALGKSGDVLEDKLVADLLKGICLPEGMWGMERAVSVHLKVCNQPRLLDQV